MKQCWKCGQPYDSKLPFCLSCEGYELLDVHIHLNILILTYRKPVPVVTDAPTMWRKE